MGSSGRVQTPAVGVAVAEAAEAAGQVHETQVTPDMCTRSKLFANGALLTAAGVSGLWSALTLQAQDALISVYVLLFGLLLCALAVRADREEVRLWFGFVRTQHGQLCLLLLAGNLAWGLGTLGAVAAAVTNAHAAYSWFTARDSTARDSTQIAARAGDGQTDSSDGRDTLSLLAPDLERSSESGGRGPAEERHGRPGAPAAPGGAAFNGWIADADGARSEV